MGWRINGEIYFLDNSKLVYQIDDNGINKDKLL